jgi:hypothetical protein
MEECIICFDETTQFIFLPCAHKICVQCKEQLEQKRCPICNTPFEPERIPIPDQRIQIPEITQVRRYTMDVCSRVIGLFLLSFTAYITYQSLNQTDYNLRL